MARLSLLILIYGIIPAVQSVLYMMDLAFITVGSALNYTLSIFTYYWVFNHLLISVKIPRLQKFFPYDRMVGFHAISGIFLTISIYYHGAYKLFTGKQLEGSSIVLFFLWTVLLFLASIWIDTPFTKRIRKALFGKFENLKKVSYDLLKIIHTYLFIAFAFISFIHVNESDFLYTSYSFVNGYGTYFPLSVLAIVVYSRVRKLFLPVLQVVSVRNEVETLVLSLEPKGARRLRYRAGQFGYLRILKKGMKLEEHPFSFLSNPHEGKVMLGIKALGDFTTSLEKLKEGDTVKINGGFGNFIPNTEEPSNVLIGSGIGIVPILALLRNMKHDAPKGKVEAFLAVTQREELLFEEELKELEQSIKNLQIRTYVYKEDGILYTAELFKKEIEHPADAHYFLCSSPGVRVIVTEALYTLGIKSHQIHFEAFSY